MTNPNLERSDAQCGDCAHMNRDRDGGRWCSSPQVLTGLGHSIRCVWERDNTPEKDRQHGEDTRKCGPHALNFELRKFV